MKVTATTTSTPLLSLFTASQKLQIQEIKKAQSDFIYYLKVVGEGMLYIENGDVATTTDSMPWDKDDGLIAIEVQGFSKLNVRSASGTVDVRILAM